MQVFVANCIILVYRNEMNIPNKALVLIVIVSIASGVALEHQLIAIKKETDTSKISNDITTVIKEKKNKDGSIEKDTVIVDKSKKEDKTVIVDAILPPNWFIGVGVGLDDGISKVYTATINRRILGPIFLGVWASSQKSAGVSLAVQF